MKGQMVPGNCWIMLSKGDMIVLSNGEPDGIVTDTAAKLFDASINSMVINHILS